MAQVIKVSDGLYRLLKEKAAERGVTIKEALGETLREAEEKVAELQTRLAQKVKEFKALQATHEGTRERYNREIAYLQEEIRRLRGELSRYRARVGELSSALEEEKSRRKAVRERLEGWERAAFTILPLGLVSGLLLTDVLDRALDKGLKELLFPLLGGAVGAAAGNHLEGKPGLLIGAAVGLLAGGIASHLWYSWQARRRELEVPPLRSRVVQVTHFRSGK